MKNQFRKKPVIIQAHQWFKNGDHPLDDCLEGSCGTATSKISEGKIVRFFRRPDVPGRSVCSSCQNPFHVHGWIDTLEGGHIVCPGDWIITGVKGERYPCKPDIFSATYEIIQIEGLKPTGIDWAGDHVQETMRENERLKKFLDWLFGEVFEGSPDGGDIQDQAEEMGILVTLHVPQHEIDADPEKYESFLENETNELLYPYWSQEVKK